MSNVATAWFFPLRRSVTFPRLLGLSLWLTAGAVSALAADSSSQSSTTGRVYLTINGADCGQVYTVDGGNLVGDVVSETSIGGAAPQKHLSGTHYAPLLVEMYIPTTSALNDWISDLGAGRSSPKTVVLTECEYSGQVRSVSQFNNALLSEVSFPALDSSSKDSARLTLTIAVTDRQALSLPGPIMPTGLSSSEMALLGNYRLQIGAWSDVLASKVSGFTLKRGPGGGVTVSSIPSLSNLMLSIRPASNDLRTWANDFLQNGGAGANGELNGSLTFLATDLHPVLTLQLGHIGVVQSMESKLQPGATTVHRWNIELYFETLTVGSASGGPASTSPTSPRTPAGSTALGSGQETLAAKLGHQESSANTNASDQVGQDPKDFPRAPHLVRKTYAATAKKDKVQEIATYVSTDPSGVLDEFYTAQLTAAGWTSKTHFAAKGNGASQEIMSSWKTATREAVVGISQSSSGVSVSVSVSSPATP